MTSSGSHEPAGSGPPSASRRSAADAAGKTLRESSDARNSAAISAVRPSSSRSPTRASLGGEQLLEPRGVVERPHERQVQALALEEVAGDALYVLDRDRVELAQELVGILDLALQHLAPQPVLDRALRAL